MIKIDQKSAFLEITLRCYNLCTYCLKKLSVDTHGTHLPIDEIKKRVGWLKEHTDTEEIYLIGGEPLLHPEFRDICEYVLGQGLRLCIITSGVVSRTLYERDNLRYLLELYKLGLIFVELSFHPGRNEKQYTEITTYFKSVYLERRENLKKSSRYDETDYDLISTLVIPHGLSKLQLFNRYNSLLKYFNWQYKDEYDPKFLLQLEEYQEEFEMGNYDFSGSVYSSPDWKGFRVKTIYSGEVVISNKANGIIISLPPYGACPAEMIKFIGSDVLTEMIYLRFDGGLVFPRPQCIDMPSPILNVSLHHTDKEIYRVLRESTRSIHNHNLRSCRIKALSRVNANGELDDCSGCNANVICNLCWSTTKPWQEE